MQSKVSETQRKGHGMPAKDEGMRAQSRSTAPGQRLLLIVNNPAFFMSHRLAIAQAAQARGYEVHIATMDGPAVAAIKAHGFTHHVLPLTRSGKNPLRELGAMVAIWRLLRRLRPDIVHAVTIKPVLYGGIAARLAGTPRFIAAVSGLGYVFTQDTGWLRRLALFLYARALGGRHTQIIFQNRHDQQTLVQAGVARPEQAVLIPGSGVDVGQFSVQPEPPGPVVIMMVARLLRDKGVQEFVEAARLLQAQGHDSQWWLVGGPDPGNPASVSTQEVEAWHEAGLIHWWGERDDIADLYARAHIAVLPSYREGLPKSLLEAAAAGRPVVTTDVPGCRDAIIDGQTGLLVPPGDAAGLAQGVGRLIADPALRQQMGQAGRQLVEEEFALEHVVQAHLDLYAQARNS